MLLWAENGWMKFSVSTGCPDLCRYAHHRSGALCEGRIPAAWGKDRSGRSRLRGTRRGISRNLDRPLRRRKTGQDQRSRQSSKRAPL